MSRRLAIAQAALSQLGSTDPSRYWLDVLDPPQGDPRNADGPLSWCGAFALWSLHESGHALGVKWIPGRGFLLPNGCRTTRTPRVGDVAYRRRKQHYAVVVRVNDDGTVDTVDGNSTDGKRSGVVALHERTPLPAWDAFYDVSPLLSPSDTEPSPPPEDDADDEPTRPDRWVKGLDVSDIQDPARLDYVAAFSQGYRWLVAKLSDGKDADSRGAEHLRNARRAGILVGGYHFLIPWRDPRTQLDAFVRAAAAAQYGTPGHLLPWLDIESWRSTSGAWRQAEPSWNDVAEPLAELITAEFGWCCIYINHADWLALGSPTWIDRYPLAAAHYGVPAGSPRTAGGLQWAIHQWRVAPLPGIYPCPIDQNVARTPLPLVGRDVPEPTKLDPAEIERLQIPLTVSLEEHWAFRDQVIRQHTDEGRFD